MKRYIYLLVGILGFVPIWAQQSDYYYYYKGERIYLDVDSTHLHVISTDELEPQDASLSRAARYRISSSVKSRTYSELVPLQKQRLVTTTPTHYSTLELSVGMDASLYNATIKMLEADNNVQQVLPTFHVNGKRFDVSNNFLVRLFDENDITKLDSLASIHNIEILGSDELMPLYYILSCNKFSTFNAIKAANVFYESGLFASSEPEMLYYNLAHSENEYYANQQSRNNDEFININVEEAWEFTKGKNVNVAVYDHGIQLDHPDLRDNITLSYDAITDTSPSVVRGNHGTACAGVIGAVQNGFGVTGIAPQSNLMSISLYLDTLYDSSTQIARGFYWAVANEADIINCSWGGYSPTDVVSTAIQHALNNGREWGGVKRGTVIVCSAGNNNTVPHYPANSDPRILCVGAVTMDGTRLQENNLDAGSNYGTVLDVVAPGVSIATTDLTGNSGYDYNSDYYYEFSRTSAACAHVSGVAALVLGIHPDLTIEQVASIIEHTAQKVHPDLYTYQTDTIHTSGTWNEEVGYGLVDAGAAVALAYKASRTSYYRDMTINDLIIEYDYDVELENVTIIPPYGFLEIDKVYTTILRSSVIVEKGGRLIIYKEPLYPLD